jgi:hypothetical protein
MGRNALKGFRHAFVFQNAASGNKPESLSGLVDPAAEQNLVSFVENEQIDRDQRGSVDNLKESLFFQFHSSLKVPGGTQWSKLEYGASETREFIAQ